MRRTALLLVAVLAAAPISVQAQSSPSSKDSSDNVRFWRGRFHSEPAPAPDISEIPFDKIQGPFRDRTIEILQKPVSYHAGSKEMFPCDPELLQWLIAHPVAVGQYWKQLGLDVPGLDTLPDGFICRDEYGSVVTFHVVCEQPNMRICYCVGEAPAGILPLKVRAELVIVHRYKFQKYDNVGDYVEQQLDGYASASGATLRLAMKLAPGQAERMVETCLQEMKVYFSVMCRLMQVRPEWSMEQIPATCSCVAADDVAKLEGILAELPKRRSVTVLRVFPIGEENRIRVEPDLPNVAARPEASEKK